MILVKKKILHKLISFVDILEYFYNSIPGERINISLSLIDDIILKIYNNETDDINKIVHKLREQILYMLSFQKTIKDDQ